MTDLGELDEFQARLSRWRDGCLFFFKLDLVLIAAVAAVVSYLKLQDTELLVATYQYSFLVNVLAIFLAYALIFQLFLTDTANTFGPNEQLKHPPWPRRALVVCRWAYIVQTLAHVGLFIYAAGFLTGYAGGFVSQIKGG